MHQTDDIITEYNGLLPRGHVSYSRTDPGPEYDWMKFTYVWLHLPTKTRGTRIIYVRNQELFLALLNYWNGMDANWVYSLS